MFYNNENEPQKKIKSFCKRLRKITDNPEDFLNPSHNKVQEVDLFLKDFYSFTTKNSNIVEENNEILPDLFLESMDAECIWQQLEIRNKYEMPIILEKVSRALAIPENSLHFKIKTQGSDGENSSKDSDNDTNREQDDTFDKSDVSVDQYKSNISENSKVKKKTKGDRKKKIKSSVVDDKFFKLSELDAFLTQEDKKEMSKNSKKHSDSDYDGIDYFSEELGTGGGEEEDEENVNYKDFFDDASGSEQYDEREDDAIQNGSKDDEQDSDNERERDTENEQNSDHYEEDVEEKQDKNSDDSEEDVLSKSLENKTKNKGRQNKKYVDDKSEVDNEENSESEASENNENSDEDNLKSTYELRQERLKERITELENKALSEKPWQLKGEIKATNRPQNSLLEEALEFDAGTRPAPVITQETNLKLEDIIRQRIKDQAWDDPERKVKPTNIPQDFRKKIVLDGEKSKESLAQIYEKEYQKEMEKLKIGDDAVENEEEPKEHKEIKIMMQDLFRKLDALSNFHFTPKPAFAEPKIITNTPAILIEEVAPVAISDAQLLAPEEVKSGSKGEVLGKSERTKTDKNRERRHKKEFQKRVFKQKEERELQKQKAGIPLSKKEDKDKALRSIIKNRNVSKMSESSDKAIKSSKSFFNQLQGDTTSGVKVKRKNNNKFGDNLDLSAKKLKL